ncbi:hypothetical protein F4808DRAFT_410275 [Astrocystis sublimbata]|nr:hypothetical protein F4808DRAFT_410275 [Astrocystis sublimbata]
MCIEVYNKFAFGDCQHKEYQNSYRCEAARGNQLPKEPIQLPAKPERVGWSCAKVREATRPASGKCRRCRRLQLLKNPQGSCSCSCGCTRRFHVFA